jgi:hypothetical protein
VVQLLQLNLLSNPSPVEGKSTNRKQINRPTIFPQRVKKVKIEPQYLAFNDDYFWELLRKDYSSAWRYVDRMSRI